MSIKGLLNNLQIKVSLIFLMLALGPLIIVAAFSLRTAEKLIINMAYNQLGNVADDKVSLLDRWLSERKADVNVISKSSILQSMSADLIADYLNIVGENYKVYKGFIVLSSDQEIIYDSYLTRKNPIWNECLEVIHLDRLYLSDIFLDPLEEKSFFYISSPVLSKEGVVIGTVCATAYTDTIQSIILKISLGETGECYLVDKNGTFLAHKEPRRILHENIAQSESFKNIFGRGNCKKIYIDYRGIEVLGTSRRITGTDWYLVVEQDRDEAFKDADNLKRYISLVIIFCIGIAILFAWLFSYYIVSPVKSLSESTKRVARGNFEDVSFKTTRNDEIGILYQAFDDMAKQLKERHQILTKKVAVTEAELINTDTKLKKIQLAAARSQQLAALGRLAAGVTHEIRTPLTSIKLFLQSVKSEIEISPDFEEDFEIAMKQIKRMEATINRFLEFAKPQEPIFSIVDINKLIDDCLLVVKPRANQQEIRIEVESDKDIPPIRADKKQLSEAFLNLMINALEAMTNKGILKITVVRNKCKLDDKESECLRIDFSDSGPGILTENVPRLFDPFFTTKASGAGLGLSIAYSTIKGHGGAIRVGEGLFGGTTFSILLPILSDKGKEKNGKDIDC